MAKSSKSSKAKAGERRIFSSPAWRTTTIRVAAWTAIICAGCGLYIVHEHRAARLAAATKPAPLVVAVAPKPAPAPESEEEAPAPEPPKRGLTLDDAKPMSAALRASFDAWLMGTYAKCWKAPKSQPDGDPYLPKVRVAFKQGGELAAPPKLVNPPSDPAWKGHAEAALKAVKGCDPLHVPDKYADYYPSWKSRTVYFDPTRN